MQQENIYENLIQRVQGKVDGSRQQNNIKLTSLPSFSSNVYKVEVGENDVEQITGKTFLVKMFCNNLEQFSNKNVENEVVTILSNRNLSARVYFSNNYCRVEEFIDGYTPDNANTTENQMGEIMVKLADLVKIFNSYSDNKPDSFRNQRRISQMFPIFQQVNKQCQRLFPESYEVCKKYTEAILEPSIRQNLEKLVPKVLVPTHNDCHFHNILIRNKDKKIFLIDFQFFSPNYRGFEVGNFFNEYTSNYQTFDIQQELQLPEATKDFLVSAYYNQIEPSLSLEEAKKEVEVGRMIAHLFWLFIGVKQIQDPKLLNFTQYYIRRRYEEFMKYYSKLVKGLEQP